jgi:sulfate/thiosulfate transport system permease protein
MTRLRRYVLRFVGLSYLGVLLVAPVSVVFYRAFENGFGAAWDAVTTPAAKHALLVTLIIAAIAVPANTIFGIVCAIAIVRHRFPGKNLVNVIVDLPLALSPIVVGLAFLLLFGTGGWLDGLPFDVVFALPGMVLATIFVSLPFVVREVVPVLREIGTEQDEAAWTLGASPFSTFRRVTLPAIRWGITYGVVLTTARCLGEFGAVSVVSGKLAGRTETLTLRVENEFQQFDLVGAYTASVVLAILAFAVVLAMNLFRRETDGDRGAARQQAVR